MTASKLDKTELGETLKLQGTVPHSVPPKPEACRLLDPTATRTTLILHTTWPRHVDSGQITCPPGLSSRASLSSRTVRHILRLLESSTADD